MPRTRTRTRSAAPLTLQQIEAGVAAWTREELLDFALEAMHHDPDLMEAAEVRLLAKQAGSAALGRFKARVDDALDVTHVGWREVDAYVRRLHRLRAEIENLGTSEPRIALDVALHFLAGLPAIQDAVDDECELAIFTEALGETIVDLARSAKADEAETARVLLEAYVTDPYGRMHSFPACVERLPRTKAKKKALARIARDCLSRVDGKYMAAPLTALLEVLEGKRGAKRKRR